MENKMSSFVFIALLALFIFSSAFSQTEKSMPLGKYDFYHYYTHDELTDYLKDINKAFPKLTELSNRQTCR